MTSVVIPAHSSHSQASGMLACGQRYFLERGLKVPSIPNWAQVGGTAVHTATERWDRALVANGDADSSHQRAQRLFIVAFDEAVAEQERRSEIETSKWRATGRASKEWPNKRDERWWVTNGPLMVQRWANWRLNSPYEIAETADGAPAIEIECQVEIGGVQVQMFVDRVLTWRDDLWVTDIKTGDGLDDPIQLGVYAYGLTEQHGLAPEWGTFWKAGDGGTTAPVRMSEFPKARLDHLFKSTRAMQEQGLFLPKVTPMCSACGVRDYCYAVSGSLADTVPSPWEVSVHALDRPAEQVS